MQNVPQVWCVVLSWNGRADTLDCLASLKQSDYANLHIIVSENASTDGSAEAVREGHPDVTLLINDDNLRWAAGNNVGIRHAMAQGADYILLLNNDIEIDAQMISRLVQTAESADLPSILAPKIFYHARRDVVWYAGGGLQLWRGRIWHYGIRQADVGQFATNRTVDYITGCAMMIPRAVVESIGEIDTAYYLYGEDVDYSIRARMAGFGLTMVASATMWHKVSASLGGTSLTKIRLKLRSNMRLMRKYAPVWAWFTTIPLFLIIDGLRVMGLALSGKLLASGGRNERASNP